MKGEKDEGESERSEKRVGEKDLLLRVLFDTVERINRKRRTITIGSLPRDRIDVFGEA